MILLDTQALVWWVSNPKRLTQKAQEATQKELKKGRYLLVCSISIWEIHLLVIKGRLDLQMDVGRWVAKIEQLQSLKFIPIDNQIAAKSVYLPGEFHKDPADRFIVATARELGLMICSSDQKIRKYPYVQTIW